MSIECNNTTPIASRFSDLVVQPGQIIDLSAIISQTDPLDQVSNRSAVIDVTNRLNVILGIAGLSDKYPTLYNRFDQAPITYTEVADFVLQNNINTFPITTALSKYNKSSGPSSVLDSFLSDIDFHFNANLGIAITAGLCGQYQKILDILSAGLTLLDNTLTDLAGLKFPDLDISKLAISLGVKITLEEMKEKLLEAIDELVDKITKKIDDAIKEAIEDLGVMIGDAKTAIGRQIDKINTEITEFFSPENIKRIKDEVGAFITGMITNFERPTLENVGLIMFKLCNFTQILKDILFGPIDELNEIIQVTKQETKVLETQDAIEEKNAVDAGAIRIPKAIAEELKDESVEALNKSALDNNANRYTVRETVLNQRGQPSYKNVIKYRQPGELGYIDPSSGQLAIPTNVDYITLTVPTQDEIKAINARSKDGIGPGGLITFSDKVISDEEWKRVDSSVWMRLLRLSSLTGEKYVLKQGRAKGKNRANIRTAGKIRQQGQSAYHHKYSGFAVELFVPSDIREKTIIAASRVGFSGIAVGRSYLRLHVGARDGTVADQSNLRWVPSERFAENETPIYNAMMRTHSIDGYRKKRKSNEDFRFFDKTTFKEEPSNSDGSGLPNFVDNTSITSQVEETTVPFSLLRPSEEAPKKREFVPPTGIVPFEPGSTFTVR